jgi:hypothetical protein
LVTNIFYEPNYPVDMLFFTFISYWATFVLGWFLIETLCWMFCKF